MGWIADESIWLVRPAFADEFVRGESPERLEPSGEIVGVDEVAEVAS